MGEMKELWVIVGKNVRVREHKCPRLIGDHHYVSEKEKCEFCGKNLKQEGTNDRN